MHLAWSFSHILPRAKHAPYKTACTCIQEGSWWRVVQSEAWRRLKRWLILPQSTTYITDNCGYWGYSDGLFEHGDGSSLLRTMLDTALSSTLETLWLLPSPAWRLCASISKTQEFNNLIHLAMNYVFMLLICIIKLLLHTTYIYIFISNTLLNIWHLCEIHLYIFMSRSCC